MDHFTLKWTFPAILSNFLPGLPSKIALSLSFLGKYTINSGGEK